MRMRNSCQHLMWINLIIASCLAPTPTTKRAAQPEANMDLATIGALVGLGKGVAEAIKAISALFSTRDDRKIAVESLPKVAVLETALVQYQARMRILADQLRQAESLTRMVPAWLEVANLMPVWRSASDLSQEDCHRLDGDFRRLVNDSLRDHFSGTFFRTEFGKLPGNTSKDRHSPRPTHYPRSYGIDDPSWQCWVPRHVVKHHHPLQ
jgi:hypothetical protein